MGMKIILEQPRMDEPNGIRSSRKPNVLKKPNLPPKPSLGSSQQPNPKNNIEQVRDSKNRKSKRISVNNGGLFGSEETQSSSLLSDQTRDVWNKNHEEKHTEKVNKEKPCRSEPDGSEVEDAMSVTNHQCSAAQSPSSEDKHCHCICHLHRPGMKLVWVPSQAEEEPGIDSLASQSQNVPKQTQQALPQCMNCQNFLLHHSSYKSAESGCPRVQTEPYFFQHQKHVELEHSSSRFYLDILPSNEETSVPPPVPPRPHHLSAKPNKMEAPPALACAVSLRGGCRPVGNYRGFKTREGSAPKPVPNVSVGIYEDIAVKNLYATDNNELCKKSESPQKYSNDWESNDYEPLYQIYQANVLKKMSDSPEGSRRSMSKALGLKDPVKDGGKTTHRTKSGPADITLWQDLPLVRESGLLLKLTRMEIHRQESLFEVLTSEGSYLCSLRVLKDHFLTSRPLNAALLIHDKKALFSNILEVYEVSKSFIEDLQQRVDESVLISDVCDIIFEHSEKHFTVFIDYVRNQHYQEKTYSRLMESNREFVAVMRLLESSPLCKRLPFTSFLLLPFQRITRIKILIQSIQKWTPKNTKEEETASKALASVSKLIELANTQVGQMRQMEELLQISTMLEFDKIKLIPIVSIKRCLEKQGELQELSKRGSLFSIRGKCTPIYIFLFNDLLIITTKKSGSPERFVVVDYAHRTLVQVQATEAGPNLDHSFCLILLENHRGNTCERLLKANTESDMHRWIAAFPSISPTSEEEKIYEDWDCPQVQCVSPYEAKQADELGLEENDIINVLRKTVEGWYEGMRLSDRKRGWFPAENVLEVTTDHQRRRDRREQFQIAQATNQNNKN